MSPVLDRYVLVIVHRRARQRRHRLALRARNQHRQLVRCRVHGILRADQHSVGNRQQPQRMRDLGNAGHAAAYDRHLAPELFGNIQNLLDAMNRRAEAGNHDAPLGAVENVLEARPHRALRFRIARPVRVRRVGHQQQHAALAVVRQRVQVEQLVIGRSRVDLEIARVDHYADRRRDGQRHRADDRVRDVNKLDLERPDLQDLLRRNRMEVDLFRQIVFFQPPLHQGQREGGSVDRNIQVGEEERHRADVIFVPVRQQQRPDMCPVFTEIGQIGRYQVDAQ